MGIVIDFPAERCSVTSGPVNAQADGGSIIILPVIRIERHDDRPFDGFEPSKSTSRGKRRKR